MTTKPKTHRRAFLRSMATLPIVASPIATATYAATGGQDAELIALGEQLSAAWATENALRLEGADSMRRMKLRMPPLPLLPILLTKSMD
jgi:hypothetical protein